MDKYQKIMFGLFYFMLFLLALFGSRKQQAFERRIESLERDRVEVQRMYSEAALSAIVKAVDVYGSQKIGCQSNYINQTAESIEAEKAFEREVKP